MSPWVLWALWVPSVLLFILLPGCLSLSGPSSVNGTIGGSLSVRCTYQKEEAGKNKFWCKFPCLMGDKMIVKTSSTEQEVTKDRVTIRNDLASLTFTVTMEHLRRADAGKYACGVSQPFLKFDSKAWVEVTVFPAPQKNSPDLHPSADPKPGIRGSLFCSIHLWILVFLKVPVLLGLMGAILWVRGPQSTPRSSNTPVCQPVVLLPRRT